MSYKAVIENLKGNNLFLRNSNIGENEMKSLAEALKDSRVTELNLDGNNIGCDGLKSLAEALKDSRVTVLNLDGNNIGCDGLKSLAHVLKSTQITRLSLQSNNIKDEGIKYLADALKDSQVTHLNLNDNDIKCSGLKCLAQVLMNTQIKKLNLKNNNIKDEGVKDLTETLKGLHVTELDLSGNQIGISSAQSLFKVVSSSKIGSLFIDIYYTEDNDKYISQRSYCDGKNINITLRSNEIDIEGAHYLNETFQAIGIESLNLDRTDLQENDVCYLAQAFKNVKIGCISVPDTHITQDNGVDYLVEIFKDSQIAKLSVGSGNIRTVGAQFLAEFLRKVNILHLDLGVNYIGDEGVKHIASALKNSDIMYIDLAWNGITAQGAKYLSETLRESKIVFIDLCNNCIRADGARYLAYALPHSQVTSIHLKGNMIEFEGYQHLVDVVENTNLSRVALHRNNIEEGLEEGGKLWPYSIPRKTVSIAYKVSQAFKHLVLRHPSTNEFTFTVPKKDVDVDQYAFLIKTLIDHPNAKVHVFDMMCQNDWCEFDCNGLDVMKKINEFIAAMPKKFVEFIDNKLPDLIESFPYYNYTNLVKQFEDMKLHSVVQNLLLHRVLYYVDENKEILHPYIYQLLDKYNMPLFNSNLEPNKKEKIISYFQSHQELEGIHEIIALLESASFK